MAGPRCPETFNPPDGLLAEEIAFNDARPSTPKGVRLDIAADRHGAPGDARRRHISAVPPRDGRIVMCYSQRYGLVPVHWVTDLQSGPREGSTVVPSGHGSRGWMVVEMIAPSRLFC
jgi:hypothetical protein